MIEAIMYFGIGFLCASLLGLVIIPLIHNRAVRLTHRRLEATTPLSIAELQADKDQLRAEFAMSTRRLELSVEQLKARSTGQMSEVGRQAEAIAHLKSELDEKNAAIMGLETRERALQEHIRATEQERDVKTSALHETELALADKVGALGRASTALDERTLTADAQQVEITALRTQVDALKIQLEGHANDVRDTEHRLARHRSDADTASKELSDARGKAENLGNRVEQLERQVAAQATEAGIVARRAHDLEARLAEREHAINQLHAELGAARNAEAGVRAEAAATMQRNAAAASESERAENALLREHINDIAAEVARIAMTLEGPGSPIAAILAGETPATNGSGQAHDAQPSNLADRIRALQSKAARLSPVS
jgi:chromosome segregation ATPase